VARSVAGVFRRGQRLAAGGVSSVPPWTSFEQAHGGTLWSSILAQNAAESGGVVTSVPDASSKLNVTAVPPPIGGITGCTLDPTGIGGLPALVFNGIDQGLYQPGFVFPSGTTAYTAVAIVQATGIDASNTYMGVNGGRPFIRSTADSVQCSMAGAVGTGGSLSPFSPTVVAARFDSVRDIQDLWIDAIKQGESVNTSSVPTINNRPVGYGYGGSAVSFANGCAHKAFGYLWWDGWLTDRDLLGLQGYVDSLWTPLSAPVALAVVKQSNGQADQSTLFPRYVPRRDMRAVRDNAKVSGGFREIQPWGPMGQTLDSGNLRGFDIEAMVQLRDDYRINCHLYNVTRSGTGFLDSSGNPDQWLPPATPLGTGGIMYERFIDTVIATRATYPAESAARKLFIADSHGETDQYTAAGGVAYGTNETRFMAGVRARLGQYFPDGIYFGVFRLHPDCIEVGAPDVRLGEDAAVAGDPESKSVLFDLTPFGSLRADKLHWNSPTMHQGAGGLVAAWVAGLA
jgi:hypothetical protein